MNRVIQEPILCIEELVGRFRSIFYQSITRAEKIMVATVLADGENIIQRHVFVLMSRDRLKPVRCLVEAEYSVSLIAEKQAGFILCIDSKEIIRPQFTVIDDITLGIRNDRIIRCSCDTGFQHPHPHTCQP